MSAGPSDPLMGSDALSEISSEDSNSPESKQQSKDWRKILADLFGTERFTDFTIVVDSKEIKVHKIVLIQSPVLEKMLDNKFKESSENRMEIKDAEYDVVMQMLQYLYTGKAPKLNELARKLLTVAEKYDVKILKTKCEKALIPNICVNNALQMLVLASENSAALLETATIDFIKIYYSEVREVPAWVDFYKNHKELLEKFTDALFNYSPSKKRAKKDAK